MIVCTIETYMNVLVQMFTKDQLLHATYLLTGGLKSGDNIIYGNNMRILSDDQISVGFDESGNPVYSNLNMRNTNTHMFDNTSKMEFNTFTDPTSTIDTSRYNNLIESGNIVQAREEFKKDLMDPISINNMNTFITTKLSSGVLKRMEPNCICVMILTPTAAKLFGDIICSYISEYWGEDVTFLDAEYKPSLNFPNFYKGNIEQSKKTIEYCDNLLIVNTIKDRMFIANSMQSAISSIADWFMLRPDIMNTALKAHDILIPDIPIPSDHYTPESFSELIATQIVSNYQDYIKKQREENNLYMYEFNEFNNLYGYEYDSAEYQRSIESQYN